MANLYFCSSAFVRSSAMVSAAILLQPLRCFAIAFNALSLCQFQMFGGTWVVSFVRGSDRLVKPYELHEPSKIIVGTKVEEVQLDKIFTYYTYTRRESTATIGLGNIITRGFEF